MCGGIACKVTEMQRRGITQAMPTHKLDISQIQRKETPPSHGRKQHVSFAIHDAISALALQRKFRAAIDGQSTPVRLVLGLSVCAD